MGTSRKDEDLHPPSSQKRKRASHSRQTRGTSRLRSAENENEGDKVDDVTKRNEPRNNNIQKENVRMQGKKRGKPLSPAVVDVVFGRVQSASPNIEELSRKREEDAVKCGRLIRKVGNALNEEGHHTQMTFPNTSVTIATAVRSIDFPRPSTNMTVLPISTEVYNKEDNRDKEFQQECQDVENEAVSDQVFLKSSPLKAQQRVQTNEGSRSTTSRNTVDRALQTERELEDLNPYLEPVEDFDEYQRSPPPVMPVRHDQYGRAERRRDVSPTKGRRSPLKRLPDSSSSGRRDHRVREIGDGTPRSTERHRKVGELREEQDSRDAWKISEDIVRPSLSERISHGNRYHVVENIKETERRRSRDSSCDGFRYRRRTSVSPYRSRRRQRSSSFSKSRSPSTSLSRPLHDESFNNDKGKEIMMTEGPAVLSSSLDRRTRRYKEAVREEERYERRREGKKPFYLTVNGQGQPYGPGKPAWVAQVNKLATGLDPSCTHIRKQTHESMCILKERLNDNFEYSRELSEDYLRGLLGKAVTRKRTELISLIRKNAEQPVTIDKEIWERLEALANSKQREDRTEHGRYANACRRTFGRTGAIGEDGVREKLHLFYGRSPDPDEVAEEMQRDKGYGKTELGSRTIPIRRIKGSSDSVEEELSMRPRSKEIPLKELRNEEGNNNMLRVQRRRDSQENEALVTFRSDKFDRASRGAVVHTTVASDFAKTKNSKDEYIAALEAQLRVLKGGSSKDSSSQSLMLSESALCRLEENDRESVDFGAQTSRAGRTRRVNVQRKLTDLDMVAEYSEG